MLRMKIVIEKDCVVGILAQQYLRAVDIISNVYQIAFETFGKPMMSSLVVVEQKNTNRMPLRGNVAQTELAQ
jgi:hypothetical protein